MKNYKVTVGGIDITSAVANFSCTEKLNEMTTGVLKLKHEELLKLPALNYAAEVRLVKLLEEGDKTLFRGAVTSVSVPTGEIDITIASGVDLFQETVIQGMAAADINHLELVWSIVRGAGLGEERINIEGFKKGPLEPFECIVPVSGIKLSKDLSFSAFELTSDPRVIEVAKTAIEKEPTDLLRDFEQSGLWLRLIVRAMTLHDAEAEGIKATDLFLARLASRIQLGASRLGEYHGAWERNRLFTAPARGEVVFVRGLTTRRRWLRRPFGGSAYTIDIASLTDIDFPPLSYDLPDYLTEAFLAWRRLVDANHPIAAITALWDAIEFYSSKITVPNSFTKAEIKQIRMNAAKDMGNLDDRDKAKRKRVDDVLGMLNQASLIMKFELALKEDSVALATEEMELLKSLRETRNNFVHGKEVKIPTDAEMLLAKSIVNRILVARTFRLTRPQETIET